MKLIALIENVNNPNNKFLIGDIVILDSKLRSDSNCELCYQEVEHGRTYMNFDNLLRSAYTYINVKHSVANVDILGVL